MFIPYNPNPERLNATDCTIRAITKATGKTWDEAYAGLAAQGFILKRMPSDKSVWDAYLRREGFKRHLIECGPHCEYTVKDFCRDNPKGTFILALDDHVICIKDGSYYDTWDSGLEIPVYCWARQDES